MGGSVPDLKGRVRFVSDGSLRNLIDAVDLWKTGFEGQIRMSVSYYYPETAELKEPKRLRCILDLRTATVYLHTQRISTICIAIYKSLVFQLSLNVCPPRSRLPSELRHRCAEPINGLSIIHVGRNHPYLQGWQET